MSLYYEAAQVLEVAKKNGGSIKSHVFSNKTWKSNSKSLFALSTEASKWSEILSEVIERSDVLGVEKQVCAVFIADVPASLTCMLLSFSFRVVECFVIRY
jgi:hypothetical protein